MTLNYFLTQAPGQVILLLMCAYSGAMTLSILTHSIMTFSRTTICIKD
jgi:hypothetical protein